jgi:hypothetical protein
LNDTNVLQLLRVAVAKSTFVVAETNGQLHAHHFVDEKST